MVLGTVMGCVTSEVSMVVVCVEALSEYKLDIVEAVLPCIHLKLGVDIVWCWCNESDGCVS